MLKIVNLLLFIIAVVRLQKLILPFVSGSSGTISMANKADMPYTSAFIQEVYRYRTLAPLSVPHKTNADTILDGYIIPKNIQVFALGFGFAADIAELAVKLFEKCFS